MMKIRTALALLSISLASTAFAQSTTTQTTMPRVDKREARQQQRIDKGVASGELTQKEALRMEKGQARVDLAEANAKADGQVTRKERYKLDHMQDKQSAKIYRNKHDKQAVKPAV
jgi:hypothetical protein